MSAVISYVLLALIALAAYFQEAITGAGGTAVALPFAALLLKLALAKQVLVMQAWIVTAYVTICSHKVIGWRAYGRILVVAGAGLPLGIYAFKALPLSALMYVLSAFVVVVAARGFVTGLREGVPDKRQASPAAVWLMNGLLFLGGVIHGAFGTGGPFVMIYAAKILPEKGLFRATLCLLWFTLNSVLIGEWAVSRTFEPGVWPLAAACAPFTVLGMVLGNHLHHRINERAFRLLVFAVLFLSGIALVYSASGGR